MIKQDGTLMSGDHNQHHVHDELLCTTQQDLPTMCSVNSAAGQRWCIPGPSQSCRMAPAHVPKCASSASNIVNTEVTTRNVDLQE